MTLNDLKWRNSPYFAFFSPISISLLTKYVALVEYRPILSVNIVPRFQSSTFGHYLPTLQRGLSVTAELLVHVTTSEIKLKQNCFVSVLFQFYFRCNHCFSVTIVIASRLNFRFSFSQHIELNKVDCTWRV